MNLPLRDIYKVTFREDFNFLSEHSRQAMQSCIYLAQDLGVIPTSYNFAVYNMCVFSQCLMDDLEDGVNASTEPVLSEDAITLLAPVVELGRIDGQCYDTKTWLCCLALMHTYLRGKFHSKGLISVHLDEFKESQPRFCHNIGNRRAFIFMHQFIAGNYDFRSADGHESLRIISFMSIIDTINEIHQNPYKSVDAGLIWYDVSGVLADNDDGKYAKFPIRDNYDDPNSQLVADAIEYILMWASDAPLPEFVMVKNDELII